MVVAPGREASAVRNISNDASGRVKVRPFESIYEAALEAVEALDLDDDVETGLIADVILSAATLLTVVWLRARGTKTVAAQSDWPGDRLGLRTVGPGLYMSGVGCES